MSCRQGASLAVLDKEDKSAVYWAASQNNVDCLMVTFAGHEVLDQIDFVRSL